MPIDNDQEYTRDDAALEGETNVVLEELQGNESITLDDLRRIPGTSELSDAELQQMWDEAQGSSKTPDVTSESNAQALTPQQRAWKYYGEDGNEVSDFSKLTVEQFLKGQLGYNAMGKEQRKAVDDIIRVAQLGHLNENKLSTALHERNLTYQQLTKLRNELSQYQTNQKGVSYALDQYLKGNAKPLQTLIDKYSEALNAPPREAAPVNNDAQLEMQGQQVFYERVLPETNKIAQRYGLDPQVIANEFMAMVNNEPAEFLTPQKFEQMLQYDLPNYIESLGYRASGAAAPQPSGAPNPEVAALQKQLAELRAQVKNQTVSNVKNRKTPAAAGASTNSNAGNGGEATIPPDALASVASFKSWLGK